jgi:hypothetical protein
MYTIQALADVVAALSPATAAEIHEDSSMATEILIKSNDPEIAAMHDEAKSTVRVLGIESYPAWYRMERELELRKVRERLMEMLNISALSADIALVQAAL